MCVVCVDWSKEIMIGAIFLNIFTSFLIFFGGVQLLHIVPRQSIGVQGTGECGGVRRGYFRPNILHVQENVIRVFSLSPVKWYSLQIPLILQCTFMWMDRHIPAHSRGQSIWFSCEGGNPLRFFFQLFSGQNWEEKSRKWILWVKRQWFSWIILLLLCHNKTKYKSQQSITFLTPMIEERCDSLKSLVCVIWEMEEQLGANRPIQ